MTDLVDAIRRQLAERSADRPAFGKKLRFDFGADGALVLDGTGSAIAVRDPMESEEAADAVITVKPADLLQMMEGKLSGQTALMSGRLKLKGNAMVAMQIGDLLR